MNRNQSTESQRRFIESLARKVDEQTAAAAFAKAASLNGNAPKQEWESVNQFSKRLTKTAASRLIDLLKDAA